MASNTALHLGVGLTACPKQKNLESETIRRQIAAWEATGKQVEKLGHGATGRPAAGRNRGSMNAQQRATLSKQRQTEGPMSVEPTTTS